MGAKVSTIPPPLPFSAFSVLHPCEKIVCCCWTPFFPALFSFLSIPLPRIPSSSDRRSVVDVDFSVSVAVFLYLDLGLKLNLCRLGRGMWGFLGVVGERFGE